MVLRITEVEAYGGPEDSASHCRAGRTARNAPMWGPGGHAYVYLCYGLHSMLNVVTGAEGEGQAVLIRACEAIDGHEIVCARRGQPPSPRLLAGPDKVGAALALDRELSAAALFRPGPLEIHAGPAPAGILAGPRVGIDFARRDDRRARLRFAVADSAAVSHRRGLSRRAPMG